MVQAIRARQLLTIVECNRRLAGFGILLVEFIGLGRFIVTLLRYIPSRTLIYSRSLELHDMDGANVGDLQRGLQDLVGRKGVQIQNGQRFAITVATTERHIGDIDLVLTENCTDLPNDSRYVVILENQQRTNQQRLDITVVDPDNTR